MIALRKNIKGPKMKFLGVIFSLFIACSNIVHANQEGFEMQYVKPIVIKVFSNTKGVVKEESLRCTPQTCCFSERFYCFMENGKCICDLHVCHEWPEVAKSYWMEITGTESEKYCGRARFLHELTHLCLCDPNKIPACDECNPPSPGAIFSPGVGISLPQDCRGY